MKKTIFLVLFLPFFYTGCYRSSSEEDPKSVVANIERSKKVLAIHIDQLEYALTPQQTKKKIICNDFPEEYKLRYIPNMMKLNSIKHIEANLLEEMDKTLDYYRQRDQIRC